MSSSYDIQRRLDSQFSRAVHKVSDLSKEGTPDINDMLMFKLALMQETTANYAAGQMSSLNHSLNKSIIDSIN